MSPARSRSFSSPSAPHFSFFHTQIHSPVSPTYTSFSVPSPFSSASSASFPNEGSPVSDPPFDSMPDPDHEPVAEYHPYQSQSAVPIYTSQGEMAYPSVIDSGMYDYGGISPWSPEAKKQIIPHHMQQQIHHQQYQQQQPHPSHSLPSEMDHMKSLSALYIPSPSVQPQRSPTVIHSPVPSHPVQPRQQQQEQQASQSNHLAHPTAAADCLLDIDLEDWHNPPSALHAQFSPTHSHSHTHSIALAQHYTPSTASASPPQVKQEDLPAYTALGTYSHQQHLPPQQQQQHIFDLSTSVSQTHITQQQQHSHLPYEETSHSHLINHFYSTQAQVPIQQSPQAGSPHLQQQHYPHQSQQQPLHVQTQQRYIHPSEVSPRESTISPAEYAEALASTGGCDPRYVVGGTGMMAGDASAAQGSPTEQLYDVRGGPTAADEWSKFQVPAARLDSEGEEVDWEARREEHGRGEDDDAEGEEDLEYENPGLGSGGSGEDEEDEDEDEGDDDDSRDGEFVLGARQRRASSYTRESRSLRLRPNTSATRGSERYSPYAGPYTSSSSYRDGEYPHGTTPAARIRRISSDTDAYNPTSCISDGSTSRRRVRPSVTLPIPIPVPNLTKKSRGRRVPTVSEVVSGSASAATGSNSMRAGTRSRGGGGTGIPMMPLIGKGVRTYTCVVPGCGKLFARGEHLKRHVRSIHTHDKPHSCPCCGRGFSRNDNLQQHLRVHKDYVPSKAIMPNTYRQQPSP